jgi:hypothetical protein
MKNNPTKLWGLAALFILLFSILSCGDRNQKPQNDDKPIIDAPEGIISLNEADAIYKNYTKHRVSLIETYETQQRSSEEAFEAARFVDFDYQLIKDYIAYVDQEAKKAGVEKVTKLRMYFANYPDKKKFPDGQEVIHPKQNSIFMTPTLEKKGVNYSFYIGNDEKPKLIIDWKSEIEKGMGSTYSEHNKAQASLLPSFFTNSAFSQHSLILNHGHGPPPPRTEF